MKINKWIAGGLVVLTGFILACSGEDADNQAKSEIPELAVLPGEDTTARELDQFDKRKNVLTKKNYQTYLKVSKKVKNISFFTVTKSGLLFLKTSEAEALTGYGELKSRVKFGLVDENGKELLATEYEYISNPGFVVKDMVEIKQGGKYGLFNYTDKSFIPAKYDVIYPSKIMEYVAIGEIGGKLFKIYKDGKQKAFTETENAPNYFNLLKDFRFNYQSKFFAWWYDADELEHFDRDYGNYGMIMPPSYLNQLKVFPKFMYGIYNEQDSLNYEPLKQIKRTDDIVAMTTSLYRMVSEARGNVTNTKNLITINKSNQVVGSVELYSVDDYSMMDANQYATPAFKFINDSLVEVKNYVYMEQEEEFNSFMSYTYRTKYEYYSIERSGKITALGNGNYPMISAIDLSRNHFKGSFYRNLREDEIERIKLDGTGPTGEVFHFDDPEEAEYLSYQITDHLSVADMEFMINELYAYKGMKFTDPALNNYFAQFTWYKPKYKNVDSKLSDLEKRNVAMIKRYLKDIKSNPGKFIHTTVDESHAAG